MDSEKILHNRKIREQAQKWRGELFAELGLETAEDQQRFVEAFAKGYIKIATSPGVHVEPMSYDEARAWWHNTEIPFGQYQGSKMCDIPGDYLVWLHSQADFRSQLDRFLRSEFWRSNVQI